MNRSITWSDRTPRSLPSGGQIRIRTRPMQWIARYFDEQRKSADFRSIGQFISLRIHRVHFTVRRHDVDGNGQRLPS